MIPIRWSAVWLVSCLLAAALGAPVNDAAVVAVDASATSAGSEFDAAIAEVRAKREALKKKPSPARLRLSKVDDGGDDSGEEDDASDSAEEDEAIATLLASVDSPAELNALAKEIALDFLMEESAREAHRTPAYVAKKKKSRATLDDERRKRANGLFYRLMDQELENNDDDGDDPFGQDERDGGEIAPDGDDSDDDTLDETVARALANQGLSRREIEAVLSQLDNADADSDAAAADDDDKRKKKKKKRSGDWRKYPRGGLRWRFLHSLDADDAFDDDAADDSEEQRRFFGRGFHRMGPGVVNEISRGTPGVTDKRMLRPLKARRTYVGVIKKRSVPDADASVDKAAELPDVRAKTDGRKKRSVSSEETPAPLSDDNKNETTPPRALPLAGATTAPENQPKDETAHSALIRKKSVDWDDYFGFDKRKRAAAPSNGRAKEDNEDVDDDDEVMKDYLENEYYKAIAGSLAYRRKRGQPAPADHAAGHGMMKKSNATSSRGVEQRKLNQLRAQMVAHMIDELDADDLDEMADRLSHDLVQVMRDGDDDFVDDDGEDDMAKKRRSVMQHYRKRMLLKKKKSVRDENDIDDKKRKRLSFTDDDDDDDDKRRKRFRPDDDKRRKRPSPADDDDDDDDDEKKRRKRFPVKRAPNARRGRKESDSDDDECVIAEQVVAICDMVSHLYGGYRPVLGDACFRHQACSICSDNEDACDVEYQRRVMALCGPDLLCQSQSRRLLTALNQLDEMEASIFQGSQRQIEALCRRDTCLAELFKRR